jgi:two-component system, chemotaxis family, CheB/CheR fusion protein
MKKSSVRQRKARVPPATGDVAPFSRPSLERSFPIVGIGASAGGLEAFSALLMYLPEKTGMAFVFLQHLDPTHTSALGEILSRKTRIPVHEVTNGTRVEPNHVYVVPANADMTIKGGHLRLAPRALSDGKHHPIDTFFRSLAENSGDRAISVILSGTATDGTAGCKAIKEVGGVTFAQDEASARYPGMPTSATSAGCIDFVLPPQKIAEELARISKLAYVHQGAPRNEEPLGAASKDGMRGLYTLLRDAKNVDFSLYKQTTLQRRVKRRMVVTHNEKLSGYTNFVRKHPQELAELYRDLLIPVTNFFRDPAAFDALRNLVFPTIAANNKSASVRVWVPGCSTGEEAYSLAMLFMEFWSDTSKNSQRSEPPSLQIFATDINDEALDRARAGAYPESALTGVSNVRLKRFFSSVDGSFRIHKAIRELCVFARHNIVKDPPFSSLDLISCRNLLIYLGPDLQKRVLPNFHYALKPSGYLLVGTAESLVSFGDHFTVVDKKHRIYKKKQTGARLINYYTAYTAVDQSFRKIPPADLATTLPSESSAEREIERILISRFMPASIVVNSDLEIVRFRGETGAYLEPPSGQPTFSLAKMAREGLFVDLRAALSKAKKENTAVRKEGVALQSDGRNRLIDLEVVPVGDPIAGNRFYLIVFQESPRALDDRRETGKVSRKDSHLARQNDRLSRELRQLRHQLQSIVEENEATSEELKTANEEVLSANEELQSTNEELETAKEELQSSNEELTTLNEEMQDRNIELGSANNDLVNLLANAHTAMVLVGLDDRIRRFTSAAQDLLNLRAGDVGRRLGEIRGSLDLANLEDIVSDAIVKVALHESEVRDANGAWYQLRVRPYKTIDNKIDGAVISFQNIDLIKRSLEHARIYADALIQNAVEPTLLLDGTLRVVVANPAFYRWFQVSPQETEGTLIYELGNKQWDIRDLRKLLARITQEDTHVDEFEVRHNFEHLGRRVMLLHARRVEPRKGEFLIFLSIEDVTEARQQLGSLGRRDALLNLVHDAIFVRELNGTIRSWNQGAEEMYGWKKEEVLGKVTHDVLQTIFPKPFSDIEQELRRTGRWEGQLVHKHKDGRTLTVNSRWGWLLEPGWEPIILETNTDVSALQRSEETLRRLSNYLMTLQDEERRRIARELHDSTGQKLAAAKMNVDGLFKSSQQLLPPRNQAKLLAEASQWIDEAFNDVRTVSHLLHPPMLDEAGLASATRWLVEGFAKRGKIKANLQVAEPLARIEQPVELALFRVIQEALSNVYRHSGATQVQIAIAQSPQAVTVEVRDNGKGIPDEVLSGTSRGQQRLGVGILGMRERLTQLGGILEIASNKSGTSVKATVPARTTKSSPASA